MFNYPYFQIGSSAEAMAALEYAIEIDSTDSIPDSQRQHGHPVVPTSPIVKLAAYLGNQTAPPKKGLLTVPQQQPIPPVHGVLTNESYPIDHSKPPPVIRYPSIDNSQLGGQSFLETGQNSDPAQLRRTIDNPITNPGPLLGPRPPIKFPLGYSSISSPVVESANPFDPRYLTPAGLRAFYGTPSHQIRNHIPPPEWYAAQSENNPL